MPTVNRRPSRLPPPLCHWVHWASLVPLVTIAQACSSTPSPQSGGTDSGADHSSTPGNDGGQVGSDTGGGGQAGQGGQGGQAGSGGGAGAGGGGGSGGGGQGGQGGSDAAAGDTGGTTDAPSSGSDAPAGTSCSSLPLCDTFDTDTAGSPPASSLWTLVGTAGCSGTGNPGAPTIYPVVVDSTQHHSGANSVKITGGDACGPLMLNTSAFSKLTGADVYGRFYVFLPATSPMTFDHTSLAAIALTPITASAPFNPQ